MAERQLIRNYESVRAEARDADWSTLVARAVDDTTRIMQSEGRLLIAGIRTVVGEGIDRVVALAMTGMLAGTGAVCLLAAAILFLHEYLMLPWWGSFGIVGLVLFAIAIPLAAFGTSRPRNPVTT